MIFLTLDANVTERLQYLFSDKIFTKYDLEAIHLLLTWLWIFAGGFVQFVSVSYHIKDQDYLSRTWKILVVVSSAFLLGPTMVYAYCIIQIVSFKLKLSTAPSTENQLQQLLDRASLFASHSKLSEVLVESLPQYLTQLIMVSAKGNDGSRVLTTTQQLSVISSALSLVMGISKYVVEANGRYVSKTHLKLASRLIVVLLLVSELAVTGGICKFSFAFTISSGKFPLIGVMMPLVLVSMFLGILPRIFTTYCHRLEAPFFLAHKLCIWSFIVAIFFSRDSVEIALNLLEFNNSKDVFLVTMTVSSALNIALGFVLRLQGANCKLYIFANKALTTLVEIVTENAESGIDSKANEPGTTVAAQNEELNAAELSELSIYQSCGIIPNSLTGNDIKEDSTLEGESMLELDRKSEGKLYDVEAREDAAATIPQMVFSHFQMRYQF